MKILYCTTGLGRGGAESQVVELAARMNDRGNEVMVVSMTRVAEVWPALEKRGIDTRSLYMVRGRPSLVGFVRFVRLWRNFAPDVVHGHMFHANMLVRLARAFGSGCKVFSTAHSVNEGGYWRGRCYRVTDFLTTITTNVSKQAVAAYVNRGVVPPDRIVWIPNGVDSAAYSPIPGERLRIRSKMSWSPETFVWLAAGRLAEPKDYPTMLLAFSKLRQREGKKWILVIAGEGHLRKELEEMLTDLELNRQVTLLGIRSDVAALMNAADAFVMSSAWEGLPMALLEASASGLPIVTTRAGGSTEVVVDGKTGITVPVGSADELERALYETMNMPLDQRLETGRRGRLFVAEEFDIEKIVKLWEDVYSKPNWLSDT